MQRNSFTPILMHSAQSMFTNDINDKPNTLLSVYISELIAQTKHRSTGDLSACHNALRNRLSAVPSAVLSPPPPPRPTMSHAANVQQNPWKNLANIIKNALS